MEGCKFVQGLEGTAGRPGLEQADVQGLAGENKPTSPDFTFANQMSTTVANFQIVSGGGSRAWLRT